VNEDKKARKPKSSFPKVRARTKQRDSDFAPAAASVSVKADQALRVVERIAGHFTGVVAYHVIRRDGRVPSRTASRKGPIGADESDSDVSILGEIDFRKRKRGR
jgi:hypothetical protein